MANRNHVVITDFVQDDLLPERDILAEVANVTALNAFAESELTGQIEDADALIVFHTVNISAATIQRLTRCRLIVRGGVGVDNVDVDAARQKGIRVANVPDYGTEEVADSTIGMMLTLTRGINCLNSQLRRSGGAWDYRLAAPLRRLRTEKIALVGLGRIGTAVAQRASAMGMEVVFYDPYKPDGYDKALGIRRAESLSELFADAYVTSLHCPLTDETHHMIDEDALKQLPPASFLVNTARGGLVDVRAIPSAIADGRLAGAAFDVLPEEPPPDQDVLVAAWRDSNHPAYDRVVLTPHAAFYSEQGLMDIRTKAATACLRSITGQPIRNVVNDVDS